MHRVSQVALILLASAAFCACSPPSPPPTTAQAPVQDAQVNRALELYRTLLAQKSFESAAPVGQDIINRFPSTAAAAEVEKTLPDVLAQSSALANSRRLRALWSYQSGKESGGQQSTASIYSNDRDDRVRLILRRHSDWGQSAYVYDSGKGFECRGTCKLKVSIDHAPAQPINAYLPPTGEPALFISDDKAFIKKLEHAQTISIDVVMREGGKRTLVFDVGGYDPAKFLPLAKK